MALPIYQIDAFTQKRFGGNPAAVVPLQSWLSDEQMLNIAAENNLAETAFIVPAKTGADFELKWFTPEVEIDLCGHATLAAAFTLFEHLNFVGEQVSFSTRSGILKVAKDGDALTMDFPTRAPEDKPLPVDILDALGLKSVRYSGLSRDWLIVLDNEQAVANLEFECSELAKATNTAVIVTAKGDHCDFVSRFFAPHFGVDEDPVTGSAHCTLIPYWAGVLDKTELKARQISRRGGDLHCRLEQERVFITGHAVTYLVGAIEI
ncbi:MAG: PhzF family phenazine biosynthesis protein [Cellvibrionaceae bacterium]